MSAVEEYWPIFLTYAAQILNELNNREIAIVIWVVFLIVLSLTKSGIAKAYTDFLGAFFVAAILKIILSALAYIALVIFVLFKLGVWDSSLLKITIMWMGAASVVLFSKLQTLAKERGAFSEAIRDNFKIIVVVEFIAHFYTFSLWTELIIVPVTTFLGMLHAYSEMKEEHKTARKIFSFLLMSFGFYLLYNALISIWHDTDSFFNTDTLNAFSIPLVLSVAFLPFLYLQSLYLKYEGVFSRYRIYLTDTDKNYERVATHYLFWKTLLAFKWNSKALNLLHINLTPDSAASIKGIKAEIDAIKHLIRIDRRKETVSLEVGWHAPNARRFLETHGFETSFYSPVLDGEWGWCCSADSIPVGEKSYPQNTLTYFISGTEEAVTSLKLSLYVRRLENEEEAQNYFLDLAFLLFERALGEICIPKVEKRILKVKPFKSYAKGKIVELRHEDLSIGEIRDYALHFYIRNKDAEHYY